MCWLRNEPYSKEWDKMLNKMLDNPTWETWGEYDIKLNGVTIWVRNKFYDTAYPRYSAHVLPSRRTAFRFHDAFLKYQLSQLIK